MEHLRWHKPRQTVLRQKIENLFDSHPSKSKCLLELSWLFARVGNRAEQKRLLTHALKLQRQRGNGFWIARTLRSLSYVNRILRSHEEGIQQAKEALQILERLGDTIGQAICLNDLAWSLLSDKQLEAAENAASRAISLVPEKGQEYTISNSHRVLGRIHHSKGEKAQAVHHFKTALGIAIHFNWDHELFWINYSLVELFLGEGEFDDANTYIERAKAHSIDNMYQLGRAMGIQARVWYRQGRLEDATSEASCALEVYEKLGSAKDARHCRALLQEIEQAMKSRSTSANSDYSGELLESDVISYTF